MEFIDNKLYIEPKEATGIKYETLRSNMARGKYISIVNPNYNGKNAKKLIWVDSLPEVHRQEIFLRFQNEIERMKIEVERGLKSNPQFNAIGFYTQATAQLVQSGERFIHDEYLDYIHKHYIQHTEYFQHYQIRYNHIVRYARTCALIEKIWSDFNHYETIKKQSTRLQTSSQSLRIEYLPTAIR